MTRPAQDDLVLPFRVEGGDASGRLARLGSSLDDILVRHAYPEPVSQVLGEALLLAALFGSTIKERLATDLDAEGRQADGRSERFILQTQSDGLISLIVADWRMPGILRGYARFDAAGLAALTAEQAVDTGRLLGKGHLAMTIDRGGETERYQGIVALDSDSLAVAADRYFEQSEQLPTVIRLAVGRHYAPATGSGWQWRGGALMVQKLTSLGGYAAGGSDAPAAARPTIEDDDNWRRASILAQSVKMHELIDPLLASEQLLLRLYHEDGVRVFDASSIAASCSCSQERVALMLAGFETAERADMAEDDGHIHITCEFCNRHYAVAPDEIEAV